MREALGASTPILQLLPSLPPNFLTQPVPDDFRRSPAEQEDPKLLAVCGSSHGGKSLLPPVLELRCSPHPL